MFPNPIRGRWGFCVFGLRAGSEPLLDGQYSISGSEPGSELVSEPGSAGSVELGGRGASSQQIDALNRRVEQLLAAIEEANRGTRFAHVQLV